MEKKGLVKEIAVITFAMLIVSSAVYFFMVPSGIVVGSISGLAMVLSQLLHMQMSVITLILNVILLIVGFIFIGKEFGAKTVYTSMLLPVFLWIFERIVPVTESLTKNSVYDLAAYILIVALGQAMLFNANASSGGLDVIAKIINKFTHVDIGKAVTIGGLITAVTSIFVYDVGTLIVSVLGTYANGIAVDYFIDGFNKKKRICIISDDFEKIQAYIMDELKRGVTLYRARGGYDKTERTELVTILAPSEYKQLLAYLHKSEYQAFVTVYTVNEVIGKWNINGKKKKTEQV
nr:YitT family protein [uncultured Sellimonas sp.]